MAVTGTVIYSLILDKCYGINNNNNSKNQINNNNDNLCMVDMIHSYWPTLLVGGSTGPEMFRRIGNSAMVILDDQHNVFLACYACYYISI
jgi:hypothetical protein